MKPTEVLMAEHRVIERVLNVLDRACKKLEQGEQVDPQIFADAVDFARNYADKLHHGKEEGQLFPLMQERGGEGGLIQVLLSDHVDGRNYVQGMSQALERYKQGDQAAKGALINNALSYIDLLRGHIEREDSSAFVQADEIFDAQDQQALSGEFERVDSELFAPGEIERYVALAEKLERAVS